MNCHPSSSLHQPRLAVSRFLSRKSGMGLSPSVACCCPFWRSWGQVGGRLCPCSLGCQQSSALWHWTVRLIFLCCVTQRLCLPRSCVDLWLGAPSSVSRPVVMVNIFLPCTFWAFSRKESAFRIYVIGWDRRPHLRVLT